MTQKEIDILLEKFESGACSSEEEKLIDQLLDAQAEEMGDIYSAFVSGEKESTSTENIVLILDGEDGRLDSQLDEQYKLMGTEYESFVASEKNISCDLDVNLVLSAENGQLEKVLDEQAISMGSDYVNYVASAKNTKSSIDVNLLLQAEDGHLDILLAKQQMGALYQEFTTKEQEITCTIDVDLLVQSLNGGLDELLLQQEEGMSKEYAEFVTNEKSKTSTTRIEDIILPQQEKEEDAKVISFRTRISKYSKVAAVFVAIFAAMFLLRPNFSSDGQLAEDKLTDKERIEAERALEQTLAALGMAKTNFDKGTDNMKALNSLKHTNIFK